MSALNQAIKTKNWTLVKTLLSHEQINEDTLSCALNSGNIAIICDVIEAGAKPNEDTLICAALSAPLFLNTILSMLRAQGKETKQTMIEKYGAINTQSLAPSSSEIERISLIEQTQFWQAVWKRSSSPNFHAKQVKEPLKKLLASVEIKPGEGILVPFCGKSVDMLWLQQQGYHVVGIDLSQEAINDFCHENTLQYQERQQGELRIRDVKAEQGSLKLICGDIFKLQAEDVQGITVVYDRAGYIAIPKELRIKYASLLATIFPKNTKLLLGLFDFANEKSLQGPPHFISQEEIQTLLTPSLEVHQFWEKRADFFAPQAVSAKENIPLPKQAPVEKSVASSLLKGIVAHASNNRSQSVETTDPKTSEEQRADLVL